MDGQIILRTWRDEVILEDMRQVTGATPETREGKKVRLHLKHYYNRIGAMP